MTVQTQVITFTKDTSNTDNATQDVSLNFTPKAIIVSSDCNTANNTVSAHYQWCQGFSDGTTHACITITSDDADAAADTQTVHSASVYARMLETSNATVEERATCAFITNGVRFTWVVNSADATRITIWAIGGSDITNAKVNSVDVGRTTTGTQDYTGLGFDPVSDKSVLFTLSSFSAALSNSSVSGASSHFGCAVSASKEWAIGNVMEDTRDPTDTWRVNYNNHCLVNVNETTGAAEYLAEFSAWITDGFRLNYTDAPAASTDDFSYLVIKGGTWDAGTLANPTTPTNNVDYSVSVNSETLRGLLLSGVGKNSNGDISAGTIVSVGVTDGTNQAVIANLDHDAVATSDSYRVNNATQIGRLLVSSGTDWDVAVFDSFTTNNFRLDWPTCSGFNMLFNWVVVADGSLSTLFERGITESSISVSDSNTRLFNANRALSESSISVSDSNTRLLTAFRTLSEPSISVSDALERILYANRSISESSISVSDALVRILYANRSISESSISVSDSLERILTAFRTISEPSISVSDAGSDGHFLATRSINEDPISVSESLARILYATRSLPESVSVSDLLERTSLSIRVISEDTISVSDSLARTPIRVRFLEDTIEVSDALGRYTLQIRAINESSISVSDSLARILIALRSISESSISVNETLARSTVLPRSISEPSISVSDALERTGYYFRTVSESSISVSETVDRIKTIIRLITEPSISISDSLERILIATRTLSDTITVSDSLARLVITLRSISEGGISVSDSLETDETKLRSISEPAITVSDSLARRLSAFRTLADTIIVSDLVVGLKPVPILAEYITDPGYTNPVRFRITWKSKIGDTLADESGDQIIYYRYDSYVPEDRPFDITDFSIRLTQGEISTASLTINDFRERIDDPRKIGKKSIVEVEFKKELGRDWQRILTGIVREVKHLRPAHKALMYQITVKSKQAIYKERILNFRRAARRSSVDSTDALTTDSNMLTNRLFNEIHTATDIYPRKNSPTLKQTGEFDMDTGSVSDEVTDFVTEIAPGLTTAEDTINQLTEGMGSIWGVDEFGNPYLRYPTEKHSGIVIKDSPLDTDSALNVSVNMASFEFTDTNDVVEGFANRLYVLNSKDTKSTASSSKASGFTTLTTRWIAQSFIADDNNITAAAFILSKSGNPTNTTGTIKGVLRASSSNGNFPTGATLATFEISLSSLANAKDTIFVNDIKTKEGVIVPGQRYWWVLQGTGLFDDTHTVNWHHDNDLATAGRFWSAVGPQVDLDPTKPGLQFNWIKSETGPVYAFSTFSSINHVLVQSDPESIKENGLIEAVVNLPAFNDDATYQKVLVKILRTSAKTKRIFEYSRVTIPTAKLFKPGELVTVIDSKAKLDIEKVINAEIVEVSYNFDVNSNALGAKYCDLRMIGFVDEVTEEYLSNKEC